MASNIVVVQGKVIIILPAKSHLRLKDELLSQLPDISFLRETGHGLAEGGNSYSSTLLIFFSSCLISTFVEGLQHANRFDYIISREMEAKSLHDLSKVM